jgi:hypothetical protein
LDPLLILGLHVTVLPQLLYICRNNSNVLLC